MGSHMLLHIPDVLDKARVAELRGALDAGPWADGGASAGPQAAAVKRNFQYSTASPRFAELSGVVAAALERHPLFVSAALPSRILPPMFNRYENGGSYGDHIDNASQIDRRDGSRVRTDLSVTVFLSAPDDYDGGELVVEDTYGAHEVKLPAGDAILYPASSLHRVEPVTRGVRIASFLWVQSLVRDTAERTMLFELDMNLLRLRAHHGNAPELVALTGHYHNLLRRWSEAS